MKHVEKVLVCIGCLLALSFAAQAVTADSRTSSNPYSGIVDRNVFGLKDPPPAPPPPDNKPPPPKITLTGITTIFGNKRALMKAPVAAKLAALGQLAEPAHDQTYMLAEGQRDGDIEVLEIDAKLNTVKVNNSGQIMTLNFDDNGVKLSSTLPAGAAVPGMAPPAPGGIPAPTPNPFASPGFNKSIPTRTLRLPAANGASMGAPGGMNPGGVAAVAPNGATLPGFAFGSGANSTTPTQPTAADNLTPEEREIMIEANHQLALQKGSPSAAIFPPTVAFPNRNRNQPQAAPPPGF